MGINNYRWYIPIGLILMILMKIEMSSECENYVQIEQLEGVSCPEEGASSVFDHMDIQQCKQICMHKKCEMIMYNVLSSTCLIQQYICPVMQRNQQFAVYVFKRNPAVQCIRWVSFSTDVPDRNVQDVSFGDVIFAARFQYNAALLPAYYVIRSNKFYTALDGAEIVQNPDASSEFLTFDSSCSTVWVPHIGLGTDPIPGSAIEAGYTADGAILYFVRLWVTLWQQSGYTYGYYDPVDGYGRASVEIAFRSVEFDILCID